MTTIAQALNEQFANKTLMDKSLEAKLAAIVFHMQELRANRINKNTAAMNSYLDDSEVQNWLDEAQRDGKLNDLRYSRFGSKKD